ncbi:MAG: ABC-F family ATP-binding cassette domain-containing protein [Bacteroidota bacterium]|nr:ABC-F family ATP-binding cassette domain-containing protein [Bacteroidota bacterium]MDP4197084.1 ABC-F family ATP-binding cassette domain-containing protein [Bacteroidota bacterium]
MSHILINKLNFHYDSPYQEIFSDLSLTISESWKTGLIGRNGRGKTTLFNLLAGSLLPTSGIVSVPMEVKCFPFSPNDESALTHSVIKESVAPFSLWEEKMNALIENEDEESLSTYSNYMDLFMHYEGYTIDSIIEKESAKIGLNEEILHRPFNTLSGGERTRALILSLFLRRDCFPLLDEPTDHLDLKGREMLTEFLSESKKGFIVASHDRYLLDNCTDHMLSINKSGVSVIQGNYSTWKYQTDIKEEFEERRYENLQRQIKSLEKAAQQRRTWSDTKEKEKTSAPDSGYISHKAAKLMKRATSIERRIEENINHKKELLKNKELKPSLIMKPSEKSPERLISINGLKVSIDDKQIISNLYMQVSRGDRIAITGKNGCGKTTLLNAISGTVPISGGDMFVARNIKISRAYQLPLWSSGYLKDHIKQDGIDMTSFRFIMSAFGMYGEIFDHPLETFSKGQLRKIDLCRTIVSQPQLLIWDEPLNYLDIDSREQLEDFISKEALTIVFVEHDRTFIENTATGIIRLDE